MSTDEGLLSMVEEMNLTPGEGDDDDDDDEDGFSTQPAQPFTLCVLSKVFQFCSMLVDS